MILSSLEMVDWRIYGGLKAILRGFELVSGLKVNLFKSKIYRINMSERIMNTTVSFLSCCEE